MIHEQPVEDLEGLENTISVTTGGSDKSVVVFNAHN